METLTIDIWTLLLRYLTPITYHMLRLTLPIFVRRTNRFPSVAQLCMQRFEDVLFETYQLSTNRCHQLLQLVRESKLWLTGGTLLAILNGDPLGPGRDLDFCVVETRNYTAVEGEYDDFEGEQGGEYDLRHYNVEQHQLFSGILPTGAIKMDLIRCKTEALRVDLPARFDFSFCGNMLSGEKLYLRSADDIVRRCCVLDMDIYLRDFNSMHLDYVAALFERKSERVEKYTKLGYEIRIPLPTSEPEDVAPGLLRSAHTETWERHAQNSIKILRQWRALWITQFIQTSLP